MRTIPLFSATLVSHGGELPPSARAQRGGSCRLVSLQACTPLSNNHASDDDSTCAICVAGTVLALLQRHWSKD
jgi:hypothetical protein